MPLNNPHCHRSLCKHCNRRYKDSCNVGVRRDREATTLSKLEGLRWMTLLNVRAGESVTDAQH